MVRPFRWDVSRREQLGTLISNDQELGDYLASLIEPLRRTAARILAIGNDSDYAFLGRTPENFYDYLSGVFHDLDRTPELHIVQFSLRWAGPGGLGSIPQPKQDAFFKGKNKET